MKVKILPDNIQLKALPGEKLLEVIARCHVLIDAGCAGSGVCGQCRVKIEKGELVASIGVKQSAEEYAQGWRQACLSRVKTDLEIFIPESSRLEHEFVSRPVSAAKGQFLTEAEIAGLNTGWEKKPLVQKFYLELPRPSRQDNASDSQRLLREMRQQFALQNLEIDFAAMKILPAALRKNDFKVTASVWDGEKIIRIEPGNTAAKNYALAIDLGTTTICGQLLGLDQGQALATISHFNQQKNFGADVISRIVHAAKAGGLCELQDASVNTINQIIGQLLAKTGVQPEEVSFATAAGNTTMTHLLLGLEPQALRLSPYTPAANIFPALRAKELGIKLAEHAYLFAAPCVASYVGGDIVAGALAAGIYKRKGITLYLDIGTNGEIVLGNEEWMFCASCSAGPAFEGGGIKFGITAAEDAIERFFVDDRKIHAAWQTIGNKPGRGICGSGIINIAAELFRRGLVSRDGKINLSSSPLARIGKNGPEILIAPASENALQQDIVFTEADLDNLLRAKAAMFAGYRTLLSQAGLGFNDLDQLIIAGNFGSYLDIENAITIGLLPDLDRAKIKFIGNGSLLGARLLALSGELKKDAETISRLMNNIELADNQTFQDQYMAAMFLPHTDEKLFASVLAEIDK